METIFETDLGKLYCDDCLKILLDMPPESVDLVITSPPYDSLRDYQGYNFNFEGIVNELFRVIKVGGVIVWVIGDASVQMSETGTSFYQALFFKRVGFKLYDTMIYKKKTKPLTHRRYEQEFEYMFVFSKEKPKTFNVIKVDCVNAGVIQIHTQRKEDGVLEPWVCQTQKTKIKGNIWEYNVGATFSKDKIAFEHPAVFPEKLAEDHLLTWSNPGDLILDPLMGSGTVPKMAEKHNRHYTGVDISKEYCEIAIQRIIPEMH